MLLQAADGINRFTGGVQILKGGSFRSPRINGDGHGDRKLTFYHNGIDRRLTNVAGEIVKGIPA